MAKKPKEWGLHYLNQQISAMRWLAKQGLTPEEIRNFRWGLVDETTKTVTVHRPLYFIRYDIKTGLISRVEDEKEIKVPIDREQQWFFLKSKYTCPWTFTKIPPRTWRREESRASLFSVEDVENYLREIPLETTNVLTLIEKFDTIDISKLNITKLKPMEQIDEAEVVR